MEKYEPLQLVNSVDEFKKVFVDVIRGAEVLHHDVSANNIMFYCDKAGCAMGVLCEWDLAMFRPSDEAYRADDCKCGLDIESDLTDLAAESSGIGCEQDGTTLQLAKSELKTDDGHENPQEDASSPRQDNTTQDQSYQRPGYRTCTGPFMALDPSSKESPPLHRYRYDLESFFVLMWICAVFVPAEHKFEHFAEWESTNLIIIGRNKKAFLRRTGCGTRCFLLHIQATQHWLKHEAFLFESSSFAMLKNLTRLWISVMTAS
ncbi:hypothetical protein AcW1_010258 [Taiwanofungus camphoratus]|nr:hypothetical protein AcW1_010258 [Antrodia cinnamomea]